MFNKAIAALVAERKLVEFNLNVGQILGMGTIF